MLYLDGYRIPGEKMFRRVTNFPGYKRGIKKFHEFRFTVPKPTPGSSLLYPSPFTNANKQLQTSQSSRYYHDRAAGKLDEDKYKGKYGTIIVDFFETEEFERKISRKPEKPKSPQRKRDVKTLDKKDKGIDKIVSMMKSSTSSLKP